MMLEKGNIIMIYQNPVIEDNPEGRAKLIREIREDVGDGLSIWEVEFLDEPGNTYARTVYHPE